MASRAGNGMELDLTHVPRAAGHDPYELMLSESQDACDGCTSRKREEYIRIRRKWDLDVAVVGKVTSDGLLRVIDQGKVVAEIPAKSLADDRPRYSTVLSAALPGVADQPELRFDA